MCENSLKVFLVSNFFIKKIRLGKCKKNNYTIGIEAQFTNLSLYYWKKNLKVRTPQF